MDVCKSVDMKHSFTCVVLRGGARSGSFSPLDHDSNLRDSCQGIVSLQNRKLMNLRNLIPNCAQGPREKISGDDINKVCGLLYFGGDYILGALSQMDESNLLKKYCRNFNRLFPAIY